MAKFVESAAERHKRFKKAEDEGLKMRGLLQDAYYFSAPYRDDFYSESVGDDKMAPIFDNTAVDGLVKYASNIQSVLMPPYQRWLNFVPGNVVKKAFQNDDSSLKQVSEALQDITEKFFDNLNNSNFAQACVEAIQDMGISTGVLMVNQGTVDDPFIFSSIPLSQMYFQTNAKKEITNFFRRWRCKVRHITEKWPDAKLTPTLQGKLERTPDEEVDLIEGVIEYLENDPELRYFHYVQTMDKDDIFSQFLNYSPFIAFRANVSPHSAYGIGVIIRLLPSIRLLNRIIEDGVAVLDWQAYPSWLISSNAIINPYSLQIRSNQTIPVRSGMPGDAIKPLQPQSKDAMFEAWVEMLQKQISDSLFLNPLSEPAESGSQTATEVSLREQNWIRNGSSEFGRLNDELIKPVAKTCVIIMKNLGIIEDIQTASGKLEINVNNDEVSIDYASPLLAIQDQEDVQKLEQYLQSWAGLFGVSWLPTFIDVSQLPEYTAEKFGIPLKFLYDQDKIKQNLANIGGQAQQQQQQQQQLQPTQLIFGQGGGQQQGGPQEPQQPLLS